jgi:hypothetical protein
MRCRGLLRGALTCWGVLGRREQKESLRGEYFRLYIYKKKNKNGLV